MVATVESLRPWGDVQASGQPLAKWTREYSSPTLDEWAVFDVADGMARIGRATNVPDRDAMASIVLDMLANLAAGRAADDYGTGFEHIRRIETSERFDPRGGPVAVGRPLPDRTIRHYRARFGAGAFSEWMAAWQRRVDRVGLVKGGRSRQTARAWLRRHPGEHARDAGPPRRPRA